MVPCLRAFSGSYGGSQGWNGTEAMAMMRGPVSGWHLQKSIINTPFFGCDASCFSMPHVVGLRLMDFCLRRKDLSWMEAETEKIFSIFKNSACQNAGDIVEYVSEI